MDISFKDLLQFLEFTVSGVIIALYWNNRKDRLERYRYLDVLYSNLLTLYFENPRFGNKDLVLNYMEEFKDEELLKYHYFAIQVHSVMESIYDLSNGHIPKEWLNAFKYNTQLHLTWLKNNEELQEKGYINLIYKISNQ
jgi:hypothetical protein